MAASSQKSTYRAPTADIFDGAIFNELPPSGSSSTATLSPEPLPERQNLKEARTNRACGKPEISHLCTPCPSSDRPSKRRRVSYEDDGSFNRTKRSLEDDFQCKVQQEEGQNEKRARATGQSSNTPLTLVVKLSVSLREEKEEEGDGERREEDDGDKTDEDIPMINDDDFIHSRDYFPIPTPAARLINALKREEEEEEEEGEETDEDIPVANHNDFIHSADYFPIPPRTGEYPPATHARTRMGPSSGVGSLSTKVQGVDLNPTIAHLRAAGDISEAENLTEAALFLVSMGENHSTRTAKL